MIKNAVARKRILELREQTRKNGGITNKRLGLADNEKDLVDRVLAAGNNMYKKSGVQYK